MKIVFTSTGDKWDSLIDPRFGRAEYLVLYDEESDSLSATDNSAVKNEAHGAGTATAQKMYDLRPDILITGNGPGGNAAAALKNLKMKIYVNAHDLTLRKAYEKYREGKLAQL
jgi:predicted Fe-Mo cluster-binding NifX family protein